jgi:hypothetical protein
MINQSIVNFVKIYLVVIALVATFLFRYEIVSVHTDTMPGAYRLDHWTGSMKFVVGRGPMQEVDNEATK